MSRSIESGIHVLTLSPFYPSQGDERGAFVSEPLAELQAVGVQCSVLAVRPWYKIHVRSMECIPPASWIHYPAWPGNAGLASSGIWLYRRLRRLVARLHREKPIDILHAHAALPCGEAARRLGRDLGIAVIVSVHGLDAYFSEQVSGQGGKRCGALCRQVYGEAARVVCISEEVRQRVLSQSPELRTATVVYNGVNTAVFAPSEPGSQPTNGVQVITSIGSLIPIKGHEVTLHAVAELSQEFPSLRTRIVGEGPEARRLQTLAAELGIAGRVEFLGRKTRQQVAGLLRESALFALPSRYEGLGVAYLEAMASGLPTVAYRGQGIQEVIRDGENGILVPEQTEESAPHAWAAVLRTLLKNPEMRHTMGAAARHTIAEGYTLRHQAQALLRVYQECLSSTKCLP